MKVFSLLAPAALAAAATLHANDTTPAFPPPLAANADIYTSCANANWPPSTAVGSVLEPQEPDAELQAALAEVSAARIKATIAKLISFGTRHTLSSQTDPKRGIGAARDWIAAELSRYSNASAGRMKVEVPGYVQQPGGRVPFPVLISNVQATLEGSEEPGRVYVTLGHYDTRVSDVMNYEAEQPGANDDASGVAVALELARVLAKRKPAATIVFAAVAGEEQGLLGAQFMAQTFKNASVNVEGMLNVDLVGSSVGSRGEKEPNTVRLFCQGPPLTETPAQASQRLSIGGENDSPARQLGRFITEVAANKFTDMRVAMIYRLDRFLRGGDHRPFLEAGYAAVRFTEPNENFDHQHQDTRVEDGVQYGDLPEFLDYEYIARVAKVDLAAMWSLANAPAKVNNVRVNGTWLSNDSQLFWDPVNSTNLAGYEVVWRPTDAPLWTHALFVGDVRTATVELSKDNVIFGVRSVGKNGYKSPVTIPFPT
ncbi:hypothetical protein D7B24_004223 [Verticillium nonalfalfae]|nr:uncharacterized protein D7B24_004223 [Verticillium nonalfalfae]RNJ52175.1 hypothetical protein D7B24_004223 [Verticillium nonalfalfae]